MFKKIALAAIFTVVSVVSFSSSSVSAAKLSAKAPAPVGAPVMRGLSPCGWGGSWKACLAETRI